MLSRKKILILVLFLVLVAAAGYLYKFVSAKISVNNGSNYQAVFLSNGQVYFGKLYNERYQYVVLRSVYYLQVTAPPQPLRAGETPPTNINLVKLGGELHGPKDEMRINRDQILFIEDLATGSRVVEAIKQFESSIKK